MEEHVITTLQATSAHAHLDIPGCNARLVKQLCSEAYHEGASSSFLFLLAFQFIFVVESIHFTVIFIIVYETCIHMLFDIL